ncbi:fructose-bisphosphate aldolase [Pseudomonas sp. S10E 269]|uniref:fructose-bisphosphate aldolase n=1 Tax=unclassified Pseudomonas TaxID=196821 RepID=UPI000C259A4E|nr:MULTISPECIES: fructose-bisphosphate aldolase [unclassified Pseudomonas]PJK36041.1 fructose-bisphosphate aldolase [Pseudomonas sp. S09F 262]PJK39984.1 fructose-bisphosphate aldolase [Pseudomonas sp. S10E 269]
MKNQLPPRRFYPCAENATDNPVLLIDSAAPLLDLHACLRERLNAVLEHLNLMACSSLPDFAERDLNSVANTARILVQDVSDVFRVIEHRGFGTPTAP